MKTIKIEKQNTGNEKGIALIWAYLMSAFLLTVLTGFYGYTMWDSRTMTTELAKPQAFYLAEAAIDKKLTEIRSGNLNSLTTVTLPSVGTYQATYDPTNNIITAMGTTSGTTTTVAVTIGNAGQIVPPGVNAAVTVPAGVNLTGNLTIDGRNHLGDGSLLSVGNGLGGVATYQGVIGVEQTNVKIGGFATAPMPMPIDPTVLFQMTTDSHNQTLNAVLGLSNSSSLTSVTYQVPPSQALNHQIYYYQVSTNSVNSIDLAGGNGILIIHDPVNSNSQVTLTNNFTGLVICDNLTLNNSRVVGAVVSLKTASAITGDANVGKGAQPESFILYSQEALQGIPSIPGASYGQFSLRIRRWVYGDASRLAPTFSAPPPLTEG